MDEREIRGYSILAKGDTPLVLGKKSFLVPSQSSNKKYKVTHLDGWVCECEDFKFRKQICKHIHAIQFFLNLKERVNNDDTTEFIEKIQDKVKCFYCSSENVVKNGKVKNKSQIKERYICKDCKKTFYIDSEFNGLKANPKIVTLTMDLYFKGLSLRDISDTIYQFYNLRISHETIRNWIMRFTKAMNDYTNKLKPHLSDTWHVDEQMIMSKGRWLWSWNLLDEDTRFLIANEITDRRNIKDARKVFRNAKEIANFKPDFIISDGLGSYSKAIRKEYSPYKRKDFDVKHIRLETLRAKVQNNVLERYHSTFRDFDKVRRGFKGQEKALTDGFRVYYNFIRPHKGLDGLTPSQKANIELNLDRNRWLSLLKQSLKN